MPRLALADDSDSEFEVAKPLALPAPPSVPIGGASVVPSSVRVGDVGGAPACLSDKPRSPSSSSGSNSGSCNSSSNYSVADDKRSLIGEWFRIEGATHTPSVKLDIFKTKGKRRYKRYILQCSHHVGCSKNEI